MYDRRQKLRIALAVLPQGTPVLSLYGPAGTGGITAVVKDDGQPVLELLNTQGEVLFRAPDR